MTRFFIFLLLLLSSTTFAQQYVRPSKGQPLNALSSTSSQVLLGDAISPTPQYTYGPKYDWSAFEAARVRIYGVSGTNRAGDACTNQSVQFTVGELGAVVQFQLWRTNSGTGTTYTLVTTDAPTASGPFNTISSPNGYLLLNPRFSLCTISIQVIPIPFPPAATTTVLDGGYPFTPIAPVATSTYPCSTIASNFTKVWMDGGAQIVNPSNSNRYIVVTNVGDDLGGGTAIIKCRTGLAAPTLTAGSVGTVLLTNYSVVYTGGPTVKCIGAGVWAGIYECVDP